MNIDDLEKYALVNNIPIMQKDGISYLIQYIKDNNIQSILEIGTAIGYSAICMASISSNIKITSIERDITRYNLAIENIKKFNLEDQIEVILDDALNVSLNKKYDLIFIDGAKGQSINFFNHFNNNLAINGTIITDNLDFHGLVNSDISLLSKNLQGLIKKIRNYIEFLKTNSDYETIFLKIGDGISITKKINK